MSECIRVDEDTHAVLAALKRDDETFDELLVRLVDSRGEQVRAGAGRWDDSDAAVNARKKREEMKDTVGRR